MTYKLCRAGRYTPLSSRDKGLGENCAAHIGYY